MSCSTRGLSLHFEEETIPDTNHGGDRKPNEYQACIASFSFLQLLCLGVQSWYIGHQPNVPLPLCHDPIMIARHAHFVQLRTFTLHNSSVDCRLSDPLRLQTQTTYPVVVVEPRYLLHYFFSLALSSLQHLAPKFRLPVFPPSLIRREIKTCHR